MSQSALINPVVLPENLNSAERKFVDCMAKGIVCFISDNRPDEKIDKGENANAIRAELIQFFVWGGTKQNPIRGNIIALCGAHVIGLLNLFSVTSPYALSLMNCHFYGLVRTDQATFRFLDLRGSYLPNGIEGSGMQIGSNMFMNKGFSAEGEVRLISANIGEDMYCDGGKFKNKDGRAFFANRIKIGGNMDMSAGFVAEGGVSLDSANIGGQLSCDGSIFKTEEGSAFFADNISVGGNFFMRNNFCAEGEVRLLDANIGGSIHCSGGKFRNEKGFALFASGMKVRGSMVMGEDFVAEGEVRLPGANIGGQFRCDGGVFKKEQGIALSADGIRVKGNIYMRGNFRGEVRLLGANISRDMYCDGGKFKNKGYAFSADGIKVGGMLSLQENFLAEGEVRLLGANISGDMYCDGGKFKNKDGYAIVADRIKIGGNLSLRDNFYTEGEVRLLGANIGGNLYCIDGSIKGMLNAQNAKIKDSLLWQGIKGDGDVSLEFAIADTLASDKDGRQGFKFSLEGFSYARFAPFPGVQSCLEWLDNRPADVEFSPQPFEHAAKVLFAMGHNNDARKILLAKERRLTKSKKIPIWHKPFRMLWDWFAGYGYQPVKTLFYMLVFVFAGAVIFDYADDEHYIVPHQPIVLNLTQDSRVLKDRKCADIKRPTEVVECLLPEHPQFQPFVYSMDIFIPLFNLHQEPYWYPKPSADACILWRIGLPVWYWIEIFMGWILTSLLVLTITGLLRPRQSSGAE